MRTLAALDQQFRLELTRITDQVVFNELSQRDYGARCWVDEDPALNRVLGWLRDRW